jgi:hypothetical protein
MSRSGYTQHDHGNTKTRLTYKKNSLLDTLSKVKHCIDEKSALSNTLCVGCQQTSS